MTVWDNIFRKYYEVVASIVDYYLTILQPWGCYAYIGNSIFKLQLYTAKYA